MGKVEISLTLTNKQKVNAEDDENDIKGIFVRTKRMVVDLLNAQPGESLTILLTTEATPEQEEEHQKLQQKKEEVAKSKEGKDGLTKSTSFYGDSK